MENAVDALKMAAAVMIFVLALSVSINAFSEARIASTTLLDYTDREFFLGKSDYYNSDTKNRIVGVETIIPAIYKAYSDESYKLVFLNNNDEPIELYKLKSSGETINTMGLVYDSKRIGVSPSNRKNFIEMILYGKDKYKSKYEEDDTLASLRSKIDFTNEGLYDKINNNSFEESSGVYYLGEENGKSNSPEVKKQKIRVITYKLQN